MKMRRINKDRYNLFYMRNISLMHRTAMIYQSSHFSHAEKMSIAMDQLMYAMIHFDHGYRKKRHAFSTYFVWRIKGIILHEITKRKKRSEKETCGSGIIESVASGNCDSSVSVEIMDMLDILKPHEKKILTLYFLHGMTLREVSSEMGRSYTTIRTIKNSAILKLEKACV